VRRTQSEQHSFSTTISCRSSSDAAVQSTDVDDWDVMVDDVSSEAKNKWQGGTHMKEEEETTVTARPGCDWRGWKHRLALASCPTHG
jgi:hypothetical protein